MSESWKNRLWSLLLVCTFAFVLSVCNKALDSSSDGSKSSSGGIAYADFKPSDISAVMYCNGMYNTSSMQKILSFCDASDNTNLTSINDTNGSARAKSILFDDAISSGWRPCSSPSSDDDIYFCK